MNYAVDEASDVYIFAAFMTFDRVAVAIETGVEAIEGKGEWRWAGFAGGAVAGDEGVVGWFVGIWVFVEVVVDVFKLAVDDREEVAGTVATDADVDFTRVVAFDDFGAGRSVGDDDAVFPDVGVFAIVNVFDVAVHFDDEAGENAFGHEVVIAIAQNQVVLRIPVVVGGFGAEEVRGDVVTGAARDFVADFEFFHELKEFVVHVGVGSFGPDFGEVAIGELSEVGFDGGVVEDFVDGGGAPVGFEDEAVAKYWVVLEMENDAEVVEKAAEGCHFAFVRDVVAAAGDVVVGTVDVVTAVVFEGVADVEPFVWETDSVGDEFFDLVLEGEFEFVESSVVFEVGAVSFAEGFKFAA